jgi:serine/threonine protein phosphatase PrpC
MLRAAETIVRTDPGRQRSGNEDSTFALAPVFALADGMGGAQAGEVASAIVAKTFERGLPAQGTAQERLAETVQRANREIHERQLAEHEHAGMGTTVTAAYLEADSVAIANVGDSRGYLFRDGELTRLTNDHSLVQELVSKGELTDEEALEHPQRSIITRALGPEAVVEVDTWSYPLRPGDVVMLCSDGLTDMLPERQVQQALAETATLSAAADRLIDEANAAGGRDNITVVLFRAEVADAASSVDQPTSAYEVSFDAPASADYVAPAPLNVTPRPSLRAPLARRQGWKPKVPKGMTQPGPQQRHFGRLGKAVAGTVALVAVIFVVGGGGYLATRQLYFLGTNGQGTIVVYRGLPYVLPFGVPMYETFYVSGVPASLIPAHRRATILNHAMRDQSSAVKLVNQLELGQITG